MRAEFERVKALKTKALDKEKKLFAGAFAGKKAAPAPSAGTAKAAEAEKS